MCMSPKFTRLEQAPFLSHHPKRLSFVVNYWSGSFWLGLWCTLTWCFAEAGPGEEGWCLESVTRIQQTMMGCDSFLVWNLHTALHFVERDSAENFSWHHPLPGPAYSCWLVLTQKPGSAGSCHHLCHCWTGRRLELPQRTTSEQVHSLRPTDHLLSSTLVVRLEGGGVEGFESLY